MKNNGQISFIIPYFGPWPDWFEFFLKSCSWNPSITWLIYCDNIIPQALPENVQLIKTSITELSSLISKQLGIIPQIHHPYKFVDFKPAYGLIFKDDLLNCDYWGYCDLDLVFGKINTFINTEFLEKYDVISPAKNFIPGHFALFRNTEKINNLFMDSPNWKYVMTDPKCFCFDEKYYKKGFKITNESIRNFIMIRTKYHIKKSRLLNSRLISAIIKTIRRFYKLLPEKSMNSQDFNQIIIHHHKKNQIRLFQSLLYSDDIMKLREKEKKYKIKWRQGALYDSEKEIMYFHFQLSKYEKSFRIYETGKEEFELAIF
jgi:hypothetical protein